MATNANRVLEGLRTANAYSHRPGKWSSVWEVTERTPNASNIQATLNQLVHAGRAVTKNGLYKVTSIYSSKRTRSGISERGRQKDESGTPDKGDRDGGRQSDPRKSPGTPRDTVNRTAGVITAMLFGGSSGKSGGGTNTGRL